LDSENYQFESTGEAGWHRATCRFIVPQGVRLLRCFEVSNVQGNWNTLEIRRHSVKLVSDIVTRTNANETAKLKSLAAGVTGATDPVSILPELEAKEKEEARLITRKKELEAAIAALGDIPALERERDQKKAIVDELSPQVTSLRQAYNDEVNNPLNYWCKIVSKHSGYCVSVDSHIAIVQMQWQNEGGQTWAFHPFAKAYYTHYTISVKSSQKYLVLLGFHDRRRLG
jgi:hypothetical protein